MVNTYVEAIALSKGLGPIPFCFVRLRALLARILLLKPLNGIADEFGVACYPELLLQTLSIGFHGLYADEKGLSNLPGLPPLTDEGKNLEFPIREVIPPTSPRP